MRSFAADAELTSLLMLTGKTPADGEPTNENTEEWAGKWIM